MSGCPATCANPTGDDPVFCVEPRETGCACDEGYVLSGENCVPKSECGCFKDGTYFKVNKGTLRREKLGLGVGKGSGRGGGDR